MSEQKEERFVGIDVSKAMLEVAIRPSGERWSVANEEAGVRELVKVLEKTTPTLIVVEATGIRDVPSGPLLRIGHDRFLPGLRRLVERVREESAGHTRLLIQSIDFLGIRRRPVCGF